MAIESSDQYFYGAKESSGFLGLQPASYSGESNNFLSHLKNIGQIQHLMFSINMGKEQYYHIKFGGYDTEPIQEG